MKRYLFALWPLAISLVGACQLLTGTSGLEVVPAGHGGASASSSSSSGMASSSSSGAPSPCNAYCTTISMKCAGMEQQYPSQEACALVCNAPWGDPTVIPCLMDHAAAGDCLGAGPAGGACFKGPCDTFCKLEAFICGMSNCAVYKDPVDCKNACDTYLKVSPYSFDVPDDNTFECRMKHLMLAAQQPNAGVNCGSCPDTGAVSKPCMGGGSSSSSGAVNDAGGE